MKILRVFLPLLLMSCAADEPVDSAEPELPTWEEMDFGERQAFMASDVMPAMQAAFSAYDSERFDTLSCDTCHGAGALDGTFSMPNEALYPIDFADFPTGPGADFMATEVVPQMADLLGLPPFDPETGEGFGCLGCHPAAG